MTAFLKRKRVPVSPSLADGIHGWFEKVRAVRPSVADIDLEAGVLSVKRARVQIDRANQSPKVQSRHLHGGLWIHIETSDALRTWTVAQLEERLRTGTAWIPGEWVFTDELGLPHNPEWVDKRFRKTDCRLRTTDHHYAGLRPSHATVLLGFGSGCSVASGTVSQILKAV